MFDNVCLENYIKSLNYISVGGEERIWINSESGGGPDGHSPCHNAGKTAVTVTRMCGHLTDVTRKITFEDNE